MRPLVSVIIPAHDGSRFLSQAVASTVDQSYEPLEVIVVDDGWGGAASAIPSLDAPVRTVTLPHRVGPAAARNAGLEMARGELVTFLDSDDVMLPHRIDVQAGHLCGHPEVGGVLVKQEVFFEEHVEPPRWITENPGHLVDGGYLPISLMTRAGLLRGVGGFDPAYRMSEDMDLLFRLQQAGVLVVKLVDVLVRRRIHGTNLTYDHRLMQKELLRAVRAARAGGRT